MVAYESAAQVKLNYHQLKEVNLCAATERKVERLTICRILILRYFNDIISARRVNYIEQIHSAQSTVIWAREMKHLKPQNFSDKQQIMQHLWRHLNT